MSSWRRIQAFIIWLISSNVALTIDSINYHQNDFFSFINVLKSVIVLILTSNLSSTKDKIEMMLILIEFSFVFISLVHSFSVILSFVASSWIFFSCFESRFFQTFSSLFMKNSISEHFMNVYFQLRDFLRIEHKFLDLIAINTKSFITNVTCQNSSSITSKSIRTRRDQFIEENRWSQFWTMNRFEFRKAVILLEKAFDLSFNFVSNHSRKSFKNFTTSNAQFASLRLTLSNKLSSLNLVDQILRAREQHSQNQFISSFLTFASLTFLSSDIFTRNSQIITSNESFNMSNFADREQSQSSFSKNQESFEIISNLMFSAAQRSEIADIVAIVVRQLQTQQSISSSTTETQSINQSATEYIKKWTANEIEFFDSKIKRNESVINVNHHVFYKNIYVFVNRFKNMITIRDDDKLRTILSQCFRDAVLIWHFTELFDMKKNFLRQTNLVFWHQTLINRFKKRTSQALSTFQSFRYIMTDAKFEKDSRLFAQNIFRSIKAINMNSIHNQLTIAWNNLN